MQHGIQGAVLILAVVLAYNSPVWWADWQESRQAAQQAAQEVERAERADREFKQTHYPVHVLCKNCKRMTDFWQDKGRQIDGLEGDCGICGVRLQVVPGASSTRYGRPVDEE